MPCDQVKFCSDRLIERYREDCAGIGVEITEGTARDTVMQLRAERLDIVLVADTRETAPLIDCRWGVPPPSRRIFNQGPAWTERRHAAS